MESCSICGSEEHLTFHHLIPKACHGNKWFKKRFSREEMLAAGVIICRSCHYFIHDQFSEKQLGRELNTLEKLRASEIISRHARWAARK